MLPLAEFKSWNKIEDPVHVATAAGELQIVTVITVANTRYEGVHFLNIWRPSRGP